MIKNVSVCDLSYMLFSFIPLLPASPWTKKLSVAVLKLRETGDLDYLRNKWWESSCLHKSREGWSPLQPQALGGLFLTLAIGLALGVIAAMVELSNKSRHAAGHIKVGDCHHLCLPLGIPSVYCGINAPLSRMLAFLPWQSPLSKERNVTG